MDHDQLRKELQDTLNVFGEARRECAELRQNFEEQKTELRARIESGPTEAQQRIDKNIEEIKEKLNRLVARRNARRPSNRASKPVDDGRE